MTITKEDHIFQWLQLCAPEFKVDGNQIEVLNSPKSFHTKLKTEARRARKRIVLAALYLGTGNLEKELIQAVAESSKETKNEVQIDILLDCIRGSRGEENSKTMLSPLIKQCRESNNLNIALYHTPKLRGLLKKALPARWNEVVGIAHLKVFIFDDTFIISGANLSNDYFVNRQDRYMVFHDCPELADYFHSLVKAVSKFSFKLLPDLSLDLHPEWEHHPFDGDFNKFEEDAHKGIRSLIQPPNSEEEPKNRIHNEPSFLGKMVETFMSFTNYCTSVILSTFGMKSIDEKSPSPSRELAEPDFEEKLELPRKEPEIEDSKPSNNNLKKFDTWVYPTVQMGLFGIRQDEVVTEMLLKSFPKGSSVSFTTGYFNVTDNYCDVLLKSAADYKILLASPEANGFLGSKGFSGYIPAVYVHLCKKFYEKVWQFGRQKDISLWEYIRTGWTFHGKGMWCTFPGEMLPNMTLIGSPNFGLRSVDRDLEAQVVVVTKNEKLRRQLHKEQKNLMKCSQPVTKDTFRQPRYKVPRWVAVVTFFIKRYF